MGNIFNEGNNDIEGQLMSQNDKQKNAVGQINDARIMGVQDAEELDRQKNKLMGVKDRITDMDHDLDNASSIQNAMKLKITKNKLMFKFACSFVFIIVAILLVLKFWKEF